MALIRKCSFQHTNYAYVSFHTSLFYTVADDCVGGRVYKECGTLCQITCDNYESPPSCSTDCTPTCVCPEVQVLRNGQCIETDQCDGKCLCYSFYHMNCLMFILWIIWDILILLGH